MNALWVLVGHRGVGKSHFLRRLESYWGGDFRYYDLDEEIENSLGSSIKDFFQSAGEARFRELEKSTFARLISTDIPTVIAVGAGFSVDEIPASAQVLWVRRESDRSGRIFLDRPRLIPHVHPLEEFEIRRRDREEKFQSRSQFVYTLPEGPIEDSQQALQIEIEMFARRQNWVGGLLTVLPSESLAVSLPDFYELRDDLLSLDTIRKFFSQLDSEKILFSARLSSQRRQSLPDWILSSRCLIDVPIEKAPFNTSEVDQGRMIFSSHADRLSEALKEAERVLDKGHIKLAPQIENWQDLKQGHRWQQEDPKNRSFLPRSQKGRWIWYRLYQKGRQKINFWRHGPGSAEDQPTLFQWMSTPLHFEKFNAVLGFPVFHSYSPLKHLDFSRSHGVPFFAINLSKDEWAEGIDFLSDLGLQNAAVTSPLKKVFQLSCRKKSSSVLELKAGNTISKNSEEFSADNTDVLGFQAWMDQVRPREPIAIWGGGGTLSMLKKILPRAIEFSARTGEPREGSENLETFRPQTLVWAAPNKFGVKLPPESWRPQMILDLNYADNSFGRAYALERKLPYTSGLDFFNLQALEQQKIWDKKT